MKLRIFGIIVICFLAMGILSSCGSENKLYVYNWGEYIDPEVVTEFEEETGIKVIMDTFDKNESMYAKVKANNASYDVLFPSDYMIERMIAEDMIQKLNFDNIPNIANVDDMFKNPPHDPNSEYNVPYMWGTVGIMYNEKFVTEEVDSWDILWDEKYKGEIFMYDSMRDTIGITLKRLGYSLNSRDLTALEEAKQALIDQKPIKKAYFTDAIKDKMIANEGWLGVVYSGDALYCESLNDNLAFAIPKEGTNIYFDSMVITKESKNVEAAEKFINYLCRPEIAARNSNFIGYTTVIRDAIPYIDEELRDNPYFWPDESELTNSEYFTDLGDFRKHFENAWDEILKN